MAIHTVLRPSALLMVGLLLTLAENSAAQDQSLNLQQAIAMAQRQGGQAQIATYNKEAALARDHAFNARLLPYIELRGDVPSYNRAIIPVLQPDGSTEFRSQQQTTSSLNLAVSQPITLTGGVFSVTSGLSQLKRTGVNSSETWNSTPYSVGVTQPIMRANRYRWDQREQGLRTAVAERVYTESLEDVAVNTVNAFFDVYFAETSLRNATDNLARNDTLMKLAIARRDLGTNGESDVIRAELATLNARTQRGNALVDRARTLAALRLALGLPPSAPVNITVAPGFPSFEPDSALASAEAVRNRSEILSREAQETSARRRESEASLNGGLGGTLAASYGYNATANEFDLAYNDLLEARSFRLQIQFPIMQWGARSSDKHAAQADLAAAQSNMRLTREQLAQQASFAAVQVTQARQTVESAILADSLATLRYRIQYAEYLSGKLQSDNLYIAQDEKNRASEQVVQALRSFWTAYYQLRRAAMYDFETNQRIR